MAVKEKAEIYECEVCGNEVIVTKVGGGTLKCCDKEMKCLDGIDIDEEVLNGENEEAEE